METSRCVCRITARVARLPCGVTAPQRYVCTLNRSPISPLLVSKQYSSIASLSTHRLLHTTATTQSWLEARSKDADKKEKELIVHQENIFDEVAKKAQNKETFKAAIAKYLRVQGVYRRGHVEFIYAALNKMSMFGVQRELSIYKALVDLFPKEKMVPNNAWQVEMMHYPKQQQCCIDILEKMEFNGVIPDDEMGRQLASIFGHKAHAFRKYRRMMYWMPKFKYANPYFVPRDIPTDPIELAVMALKRMAVDLQNDIIVHKLYDDVSFYIQSIEYDTAVDRTFIASAQSPGQQTLVADHPAESPVYVEGGFKVWLREKCLTYFVLRSDVTQTFTTFQQNQEQEEEESGSLINWSIFADDAEKPSPLVKVPTSHEQEDGTILATCITGTGSKDSVTTWVKLLEETNPRLSKLPVVFLLKTEDAAIQVWTEADEKNKQMSQELK